MRVVLIGPRGSGKTTVGERLAQRMSCEFVDLDERAAAEFESSSVTEIWSAHGEAAWRAAEVKALRELLQDSESDCIIALGGGTPTMLEARTLLSAEKSHDLRIIYLKCPAEELAHRLRREPGDRPSITGRGMVEEIAVVLAEREPTYEAIADFVIDGSAEPKAVAAAIEKVVRSEV